MARVKRGTTSHRRHVKLHRLVKGHRGGRSKLVKEARSSLLHAGQYAFAGRRKKKGDFRKLWIVQLGNAVRAEGLSYSRFISSLKAQKIILDRKILAELAVNYPDDFKRIVALFK